MTPQALQQQFYNWIDEQEFPCVGAKAAFHKGNMTIFVAHALECPADNAQLLEALYAFAARNRNTRVFASFVVLFNAPGTCHERDYERLLWQKLQQLHDIDRQRYSWDSRVSADPSDNNFSMSLGGEAYYIVGLHEGASRLARRFIRPAMVFNFHRQFEELREQRQYHNIRKTILKRDEAYSGSINPMLAVHGSQSEARQYSGRKLEAEWVCPFAPQPNAPAPH